MDDCPAVVICLGVAKKEKIAGLSKRIAAKNTVSNV
jgi:hypothetical protein